MPQNPHGTNNSEFGENSRNNFTTPLRFYFAVNSSGTDKDWDFELLASQFRDTEGTIEDVARHVKSGHALCAGLLNGKRRKKSNVIGSHWILLDIDNSDVLRDEAGKPVKGEDGEAIKIYKRALTLDEAINHPLVQKYCSLIYTTASHKPDWHKFRLVFLLPEFVEGVEIIEAAVKLLMQQFPHDPACKDASRVFYGSTQAEFPLINPNATLPSDWIKQAQETVEQDRIELKRRQEENQKRRKQFENISRAENWDTDNSIEQALSYIPPRTPGSGNYLECLYVLMALNSHFGAAEAEIIAEKWSPSIPGNTWNIANKIRSFGKGNGGITIGTLFHIAKQHGFTFPQNQNSFNYNTHYHQKKETPPPVCDGYKWWNGINYWLGRFTERYKKVAEGFAPKEQPPKSYKLAKEILFIPGKLPTLEEYQEMGNPVIIYGAGQRNACWEEMSSKGYEFILDNSMAGYGKSHDAGNLQPEQIGVDKLFYLSNEHRNPTTETVQTGYIDLPVRHDGLHLDKTRTTPSGNYHIRWAKKGEEKNVTSNCFRTSLFHILAEKGYQFEVNKEAKVNPICANCHLRRNCAGMGDADPLPGASFRQERREALEAKKIRAHLDSIPDLFFKQRNEEILKAYNNILENKISEAKKTNNPISSDEIRWQAYIELLKIIPKIEEEVKAEVGKLGAIVDEAMRQIHPMDTTEVDLAEFDKSCMVIESRLLTMSTQVESSKRYKEEYEKIKPILLKLRSLLSGEIPQTGENYYGWNDAALREIIGQLPDVDLASLANIIEWNTAPDLEKITELDEVDFKATPYSSRKGGAAYRLNDLWRKEQYKETKKSLQNLIVNWVPSLLRILAREQINYDSKLVPIKGIINNEKDFKGALRVTAGKLIISVQNTHQILSLAQMDRVIFMDATAVPESIAMRLGYFSASDVATCREVILPSTNLKIVQITGLGLAGKQRSDNLNQRLNALISKLKTLHSDLGIIDHLKCKRDKSEGHWFVNNRGTNEFLSSSAILSIGTPYQDIGHLQLQFTTLTGDSDTGRSNTLFQAYINYLVRAEIVQWVGRLRANRRPQEQLTCYIVSELDLNFLRQYYPGAEIISVRAVDICPEAGTDVERNFNAIATVFKELSERGEKITIDSIAQKVGITKGRISQMAKEHFGDWGKFKSCLVSLLKALNSKIKQPKNGSPPNIPPDLLYFAQTYFPLLLSEATEDLVKDTVLLLEIYGLKDFGLVCLSMSADVLTTFILKFTSLLPPPETIITE